KSEKKLNNTKKKIETKTEEKVQEIIEWKDEVKNVVKEATYENNVSENIKENETEQGESSQAEKRTSNGVNSSASIFIGSVLTERRISTFYRQLTDFNMATESPHINPCHQDNDFGPFACLIHTLIQDDRGRKKKLNITVRDRDIVVCVSVESDVRVLHLQCVRDDTVAKARVAIEELFDELKALDDSKDAQKVKRMALIMKDDVTDLVHHEFHEFVNAQAQKRGLEFTWMEGGYSRDTLRAIRDQVFLELRLREGGNWDAKTNRRHGVGSREFEAKEQEERKQRKKGRKGQKGPQRAEDDDAESQVGEL
ncbi:unnamed protein product, partial [Clonostachys byssicola]